MRIACCTLLVALVALLAGCTSERTVYSTIVVEPQSHVFEVQAKGEIVETESIPIRVPSDVNMRFQVVWLLPEYSEVTKGQIIARFDDATIITQIESFVLELNQQMLEMETFGRQSESTRTQIGHQAMRVEGETNIAMAYVDVDPTYFSRNEYIDAVDNLEYLEIEDQFYDWQADTHDRRTGAESKRMDAQRESTKEQLEQNQQALDVMELKSPEDGTFVYSRSRWGMKMAPGQEVWSGRSIGMLPIRGKVRAEIRVLEVDAVGIEEGQLVTFRIDSDLERTFTGRVESVSHMASTYDQADPTKYFFVQASFDEVDADLMRVGSSLSATIVTGELNDVFLVPQQAVFFDEDKPFLYVMENNREPTIRHVELGRRSPTLIEITGGIESGEKVSLVAPVAPAA